MTLLQLSLPSQQAAIQNRDPVRIYSYNVKLYKEMSKMTLLGLAMIRHQARTQSTGSRKESNWSVPEGVPV